MTLLHFRFFFNFLPSGKHKYAARTSTEVAPLNVRGLNVLVIKYLVNHFENDFRTADI
jgi:hypothetical protein